MINNVIGDTVSLDETLTIFENAYDEENNKDHIESDKQLHKWLTELKTYRIDKLFKYKKSDLSIFANLILSSYKSVFNSSEFELKKEEDGSFVIFIPAAIIEVTMDDEFDQVICVVSFHTNANAIVAGEIISIIKDIFKGNVIINSEPFIINDITKAFIFGDEKIEEYKKSVTPIKIRHTILYNDDSAGNC